MKTIIEIKRPLGGEVELINSQGDVFTMTDCKRNEHLIDFFSRAMDINKKQQDFTELRLYVESVYSIKDLAKKIGTTYGKLFRKLQKQRHELTKDIPDYYDHPIIATKKYYLKQILDGLSSETKKVGTIQSNNMSSSFPYIDSNGEKITTTKNKNNYNYY